MMISWGQLGNVSGVVQLGHPKLPLLGNQTAYGIRTRGLNLIKIAGGRVECNKQTKHVVLSTRQTSSSHGQIPLHPFWLSFLKDSMWSLRNLLSFLGEQPSEVKYIEWPSFNNTLKTATLSLVLVAVFIVALSSVDSALCYVLALVLRKSP